jgi:hypothetical protein
MTSPPLWNAPAHLFGLPIRSWKHKADIEMRGTMAECVQRFLNLPQHQQQNCTLTIDGTPGTWGPASIRAHVAIHGAPPQMGKLPPHRLKMMTTKELPQPTPPSPLQAQDAATIAKGAGRG